MVIPSLARLTALCNWTRPPPMRLTTVLLVVLLSALPLLFACGQFNGKVTLLVTVGSKLEDCEGVASMKCLLVNGELFYDTIEEFDYEEGYYYRLTIEREDLYPGEEPPQDASRYRYRLVEVMSKERPPQG